MTVRAQMGIQYFNNDGTLTEAGYALLRAYEQQMAEVRTALGL